MSNNTKKPEADYSFKHEQDRPATRTCLSCQTKFKSEGWGNRLCQTAYRVVATRSTIFEQFRSNLKHRLASMSPMRLSREGPARVLTMTGMQPSRGSVADELLAWRCST